MWNLIRISHYHGVDDRWILCLISYLVLFSLLGGGGVSRVLMTVGFPYLSAVCVWDGEKETAQFQWLLKLINIKTCLQKDAFL